MQRKGADKRDKFVRKDGFVQIVLTFTPVGLDDSVTI
jgi:hypothetical protein